MRRMPFVLCSLILLTTAPHLRAAGVLYGNDSVGNLFTVDLNTGAATLIGNTGVVLTDIAFDQGGFLYGIDYHDLYRVDPTTASATLVGRVSSDYLTGLVFDRNNELWAAGNSLFRVDTASGHGTSVVDLAGYYSAGDLAFDVQSRLYLTTSVGHLVEVDRENAVVTYRAEIPPDVYGFARADDGTLYGITSLNKLLTIDPQSGQLSELRQITGDFLQMTYGSSFTTEALPEPGNLLLLALLVTARLGTGPGKRHRTW